MAKGEHWAKLRALKAPRICAECGKEYLPQLRRRTANSHRAYYWPRKFCSLKCLATSGQRARASKALGRFEKNGYVMISRGKRGSARAEHRLVMEQILGRELMKNERVHHRNGRRNDNRPENLELWVINHPSGQRVSDEDIWSGMIPPYQFGAL